MKTDTKLKLIKIIKEKGPKRPAELVRTLGISPQALHRQLKTLVSEGIFVSQGRPPFTRYAISGIPDFSAAFQWLTVAHVKNGTTNTICETRDIFIGRLSSLKGLIKQGLNADSLPLLISAVGEIGNNSFDHNLGQWRDVPGCWFETQVTGDRLWICLADRGQGIYSSLLQVEPKIPNEQSAIDMAFEKIISGRAPEKRGNGLKYVKKMIMSEKGLGLACASGKGKVHFGDSGKDCNKILEGVLSKVQGTVTLIVWRLD